MCAYGGAHRHACDPGGLQVGLLDASAEWLCVPQVPHTSDLEVFSEWAGLCTFLQQGHHLNHLFWKDRQSNSRPPSARPWVLHSLCLWKRAFCKPQSWFSFPFWGQEKDSESIGSGYITSFLLCSSFWATSKGHCIEQLSKLIGLARRLHQGSRWSRCVCEKERERKA